MIPKECKRLAEVDFPIAAVSRHSVREKSIRHGHPSTLHLWWARRPLAACRAVLMALLLPDPCDPLCPAAFRDAARRILMAFSYRPERWSKDIQTDQGLRHVLLHEFIADFANWDNAANPAYLKAARELVQAAHPEETPLVVDPFAGGGSIPLEALRIGCEAFASDLNPVACLILKVMLEDIPRETRRRGAENAESLADELRRVGKRIKEEVEKELGDLYPKDPDGATPIAYLWARTVRCEAPNCGAEIPLVRSFWLCNKPNRKRALRYHVHRGGAESAEKNLKEAPRSGRLCGDFSPFEFEIFEPKSEKDVPAGSVTRAKATCLCCGAVLPPERVRAQLSQQHGGADVIFGDRQDACPSRKTGGTGFQPVRIGGARMLAVVTLRSGQPGRHYRLPTPRDYQAVWKAQGRLKTILDEWEQGGKKGLCPTPDEPTPVGGGSGAGRAFSLQKYGMMKFGDLFTARQKVALVHLATGIGAAARGNPALSEPLACALSVFARSCNGNARLHPNSSLAPAFGMQTLPITWTFPETIISGGRSEHFDGALRAVGEVVDGPGIPARSGGQVQQADAPEVPLPNDSFGIWFTDPPYYDAIPYSDLSDLFLVWLKRALPGNPLLRDPFDPANPLSPKLREAVQDETKRDGGRPKDRAWFEEKMAAAFAEGRRVLREDGVGCVVFAHKTTEGWEALLSGLIRGGWTITGSWPIATERSSRLRARDSAALATSVHLVCRPRPEDAPVGDWGEVLRELPTRVGDWMERLQGEGIRGADLVFACIGPALEIFSRYRKVETADGREVKLADYLEKVWEVVGRTALENVLGSAEAKVRNGAAGALEEDARLTALFLWTLQSTDVKAPTARSDASDPSEDAESAETEDSEDTETEDAEIHAPAKRPGGFALVFDVARRFAQPLGVDLSKWEGRIIQTSKGVVRLLPVGERAKQLFGEEGAAVMASRLENWGDPQQTLFPKNEADSPRRRGERGAEKGILKEEAWRVRGEVTATTLDRVHAAMLLLAGGQTNGLRALIKAEQQRGPDFLRLANALSALYPSGSEEKRLLDAMLLAVPR